MGFSFNHDAAWKLFYRILQTVLRSIRCRRVLRIPSLVGHFFDRCKAIFVARFLRGRSTFFEKNKDKGVSRDILRQEEEKRPLVPYAHCEPSAPLAMASTHAMFQVEMAPSNIPLQTIPESAYSSNVSLDDQPAPPITANDMARQIIMQHPSSTTGSRVSLVVPAAPTLQQQGNAMQVGSSVRGFSEGISDVIYPLMPIRVPRYTRNRYLGTEPVNFNFELGIGERKSSPDIPSGWQQLTHPEGQPYFYHAEKRIITENWIWDPQELLTLNGFIRQFEEFTETKDLTQPDDAHLVLECSREDQKLWCGYYYASASTRSVFWLETFDISNFLDGAKAEPYPIHVELYLEYQYWLHWDLFPDVNKPTKWIYNLVANTIVDARTDAISSTETTVNYTTKDLREMAAIVKNASKQKLTANSSWCIGRFMSMLLRDRYYNFHGQYGARLNWSQSVFGLVKRERSWFIRIFSLICFATPNVHLRAIERLWVDKLVLKVQCRDFFSKLSGTWAEQLFLTTIILNANVAFLSIPSLSLNSAGGVSSRNAAQIPCYISIIASFACMVISMVLIQQHKGQEKSGLTEFHEYLRKHEHPVRGFEDLAAVYSLPSALLIWGMISFLVAIVLMCFEVSTQVSTRALAITLGLALGLSCMLLVWCIYMGWEESEFQIRRWIRMRLSTLSH